MRTLCPNLDREDGLDTVLEVPIPEEMIASSKHRSWQNMKSWMTRPHSDRAAASVFGGRAAEIQFLLGVIGAPLIPLPIRCDRTVNDNIKGCPIESSMAKYIVQQYIAAAGGEHALNSIDSMYAMGKVKMAASEFVSGDEMSVTKATKVKTMRHGPGEMGGFVLWQKRPDLWSLELMVAGYKISAGSDGKVAWRQTPWQHSHASRGPPRPLRRSLQGLDPRSTANLFSNSICIGEKTINDEDCFVLKLEAEPTMLRARSSSNVEIMRHTVWGCFSQRTGLLIQVEDSHLLRIKAPGNDVFWETTMESLIQDYRTVDGVNIAHSGRTSVSLFRFGENSESHTRTRMEEIWSIEEVDFNIKGLSTDCFLPPADLKREDEECGVVVDGGVAKNGRLHYKILANSSRFVGGKGATKVVAIDEENLEMFETDDEM
ncbi:replication factor C subunit [Perilla frutescens var. hirtella]|nr:replication factor C subunit [Perilla frutescens var. hirtella]